MVSHLFASPDHGRYLEQQENIMRVPCSIAEAPLKGENGDVKGIIVTCNKCGHTTQCFGTSDRSKLRCLAAMRAECPEGQDNFYHDEDE